MDNKATIDIAFDGPVITGTMDVRELAPALLAMGTLLEDANRSINGEASKVHVLVKSDFRTGSFQISFEVVQNWIDFAKSFIAITTPANAAQLLELLGFTTNGIGLIQLLQGLKGRPIKNIVAIENGPFRVYVEGDHDPIDIMAGTAKLYQDMDVRKSLSDVVKPLEEAGIDRFMVREGSNDRAIIAKEELPYFAAPEPDTKELVDNYFTGAYNILSVSFDEGIKWRLCDGTNRITASMKDEEFLSDVDEGVVTFAKGDVIKVKMRLRQWNTASGLKNEYEIAKVEEHIKHQKYIQLPIFEGS